MFRKDDRFSRCAAGWAIGVSAPLGAFAELRFRGSKAWMEMYPSASRRLRLDCCDCAGFASISGSRKFYRCICMI
jgi:hypothetical protein